MPTPDPKREFAVNVVHRLRKAGYEALWAGGCVRDFLLGRTPDDYDVATSAHPEEVRRLFGRKRTLAVGASFGVVIVLGPPEAGQVEVATFRTEGPYLDGRRPEHVSFSSAEDDALRRDFTINGMFYDPVEQRVLDFVGGEQDLSRGMIRAIGDPHERMEEDKLRMLRAVRFTATLDFELDERTADAVREMVPEILVVSAERIAQELKRMLVDRHRMRAMRMAGELGLLPVIFPELMAVVRAGVDQAAHQLWERTLHMLQLLQEPSFELAAATLLHSVRHDGRIPSEEEHSIDVPDVERIVAICKRLRLSNQETDRIRWLVAHQYDLHDAPRLPLCRLKRLLAHPDVEALLALVRVSLLARNADLTPLLYCEEFLRNTPAHQIDPPPLVGGDDLIAEGWKPGRQFKIWLETVRDAQLNGEISSRDEALELVRRLQERAHNAKNERS